MDWLKEVNETKCQQVKSLRVSLNQTLKGLRDQAAFVQERKRQKKDETNKKTLKDTRKIGKKEEITGSETQWNCCLYSFLSISLFLQHRSIVFTLLKCYIVISWFCWCFRSNMIYNGGCCSLPPCFTAYYTIHEPLCLKKLLRSQIWSILHIILQDLIELVRNVNYFIHRCPRWWLFDHLEIIPRVCPLLTVWCGGGCGSWFLWVDQLYFSLELGCLDVFDTGTEGVLIKVGALKS